MMSKYREEPAMQSMLQDLRHSLRQLGKNPGFTLAAVVSLALGIGATTAVFSVVYAALIHPFPYRDADRIVRLTVESKTGNEGPVLLNQQQIRTVRQSPAVEDLIATDDRSLSLTGGDYPEEVQATSITPNGFDFLGVPPLLGRGIQSSDAIDRQDPQPVVVLSYKFWLKHFNANPGVLGQTIELNRIKYTIIGVAASRFRWQASDVYTPRRLSEDPAQTYSFVLRLKSGVSRIAASAALQPLMKEFAVEAPTRFPKHFQVETEGLNDWVVLGMGPKLYLLLGGVALLLVIGCGNVSILLLARGTVREHEFAVRTALGAGRARLIQLLLTESVVLALIGAMVGIGIAYVAVAAMKVILPEYQMFATEFSLTMNLPILCFSVGVALVTGILFGLSPALQHSRPQPGRVLQSGVRTMAGSVRGRRMHGVLISGQIALTLLLMVSAGGAIEGFVRLLHAPLGYDPHNVISVFVPLHENTFTNWSGRLAYFEQLRERVSQVPGVTETAFAPNATPPHAGSKMPFEILGQPGLGHRVELVNLVGPQFFNTLRIPLLQGRIWTNTEDQNGAHLAVINQTLARLYFPNGDAIGHAIKLPGLENRPPTLVAAPGIADSWLQVVGVVGDSRDNGLRNPVARAIFVPWTLYITPGTQIIVRSNTPPLGLVHSIRLALAAVNPDQQSGRVVSDLDTWISDQPEWQQEHLLAWLFAAFTIVALCLAAVGLYSVVSYTVAQRTNEFGICVALGAQRGHVLRLVFASTTISVGTGVLAGVVLALTMNTLLATWVDGNMRDPILLSVGVVLMSLVAAIACILPARRASYVDPMTALRSQ
jgi:predicted permease